MLMLKVISGGQTGADRAGLDAARALGISTGGTAPKDYWTTDGPDPSLKGLGLVELDLGGADGYRKRTKMNVTEGTLTIAIASNFNSPGERLTRSTCEKLMKPLFNFHFDPAMDIEEWLKSDEFNDSRDGVSSFVKHYWRLGWDITINVAGNSAKTSPRCYNFAHAACTSIFQNLLEWKTLLEQD